MIPALFWTAPARKNYWDVTICYFLTNELSHPKRIQGAFVSEEEMKRVIDHLKGDEPPVYDESIVSRNNNSGGSGTINMFWRIRQ